MEFTGKLIKKLSVEVEELKKKQKMWLKILLML